MTDIKIKEWNLDKLVWKTVISTAYDEEKYEIRIYFNDSNTLIIDI